MKTTNIFQNIPTNLDNEVFEDLLTATDIRIERIISHGQSSPEKGWYDQDEHEWILLIEGEAILAFTNKEVKLKKGDFLNIKAHQKHKVLWTKKESVTIWLAIFYK